MRVVRLDAAYLRWADTQPPPGKTLPKECLYLISALNSLKSSSPYAAVCPLVNALLEAYKLDDVDFTCSADVTYAPHFDIYVIGRRVRALHWQLFLINTWKDIHNKSEMEISQALAQASAVWASSTHGASFEPVTVVEQGFSMRNGADGQVINIGWGYKRIYHYPMDFI